VSVVEDYLLTLSPQDRAAFSHIRDIALGLVPDAKDGTSYGMAALLVRGKPLLGFRAAKGHLSVFPFSPQAIEAARDQLTGYALSKGTVRFTATMPLPDSAIRTMVSHRLAEIGRQ
jgi:uncharacterized protein YdhG (YjbR/CyaY superfamily)